MEFWGTEVAPGKPQVNAPGDETYCHVSQAALGPSKDAKSERVVIRVETGGKNIVLGTLVSGKVDQMSLDLIFDRDFTLSHTSTSSSVFFCGYKTEKGGEEYTSGDDSDEEEEDDDEEIPEVVPVKENGNASEKEIIKATKQSKVSVESAAVAASQTPKPKPKKSSLLLKAGPIDDEAIEGEETDEDDEVEDLSSDDSDDDEEDASDDDLSDDDEEDDSDEEEEDFTPEPGKKRALKASDQKPAVGFKKARLDTPAKPGLISSSEKKGAKKGAPAKLTPVSSGKKSEPKETLAKTPKTPKKTPSKDDSVKTPKTASPGGDSAKKLGAHFCAECKRNFASDSALSQHSVAKHKK